MGRCGAKVWYFADGYLPEKSKVGEIEAHEALMLFNTNDAPAEVVIDFYFADRDPLKGVAVQVEPERVRTLRMDHPEDTGGLAIPPLTQYAIRVRSDLDIVVQFGRIDTTQANMSYYCGIGYCADDE
jgi:hypothetical protein